MRAAALVLDAQVAAHTELPKDVDGLDESCNPPVANAVDAEGRFLWSEGEVVFNFGKYRERRLRIIVGEDPEYAQWVANSDFPSDVREIVRRALVGEYPDTPEHL